MRLQKKNKTFVQRDLFITKIAKDRHYSTTRALHESSAKAAVSEIIQMLLREVYQEQQAKEYYYQGLDKFWKQCQDINKSFFQLIEIPNNEIRSILDDQPQPSQQKKRKGVVGPDILKKSLIKTVKSRDQLSLGQESVRNSIYDPDKRDREFLIQKMKKEYISVVNTKYMSESLPIEYGKIQLKQKESQTAQYLRNTLENEVKNKKLRKITLKKVENQEKVKQKLLTTFYRKSKQYIDKIDPTNSNLRSEVSEADNLIFPKRGSIYRFDLTGVIGLQDSVLVRESNFKEITNTVVPSKEVVSELGKIDRGTRYSSLINREKDQASPYSQRIDNSCLQKVKKKRVTKHSVMNEVSSKNSISMFVLPRIKQ